MGIKLRDMAPAIRFHDHDHDLV